MNRIEISRTVVEVIKNANATFKTQMPEPYIAFYTKGRAAGKAWWVENKLEFNEVLAKENSEAFKNTIIHEVAHLVTHRVFPNAKQAHGPEFKKVMRRLGGVANTYHTYDVSTVISRKKKVRYEVKCTCQSHWVTKRVAEMTKLVKNPIYCKVCKTSCCSTGAVKTII